MRDHFLIPIVGNSCSGKSTLLRRLCYELTTYNKRVYFFDCKTTSLQPHEFLATAIEDSVREKYAERLFIACDNANIELLSSALSYRDLSELPHGLTILSTHQPSDIDHDITLYPEVIQGIGGSPSIFNITDLDAVEQSLLRQKLQDFGIVSDHESNSSIADDDSLPLLVFMQRHVPHARLTDRANRFITAASTNPPLLLLLKTTSLFFSFGAPLPITLAAALLDRSFGAGWRGQISPSLMSQLHILVSGDSFRMSHEVLARAILKITPTHEILDIWLSMVRSWAADFPAAETVYIRLLRVSILAEQSEPVDSLNIYPRQFILQLASLQELERTAKLTGSIRIALYTYSFLCILNELPELRKSFIRLENYTNSTPIERLLIDQVVTINDEENSDEILQKCRLILGLTPINTPKTSSNGLVSPYESALLRIFLSPRAPGLATILMYLSKYRKFDDHNRLIESIPHSLIGEEKLANYIAEFYLSNRKFAELTRLSQEIQFKNFKYRRLHATLSRAAILSPQTFLVQSTLPVAVAWQLEFEKQILVGDFKHQSLGTPPASLGPIWHWIYIKCGGQVSNMKEFSNLQKILSQFNHRKEQDKKNAGDLTSLLMLLEYFREHIGDTENIHVVMLALQIADNVCYPANSIWEHRTAAAKRLVKFANRYHQNNEQGLYRFVDHVFQCAAVLTSEEIQLIGSCAALSEECKSGPSMYFRARFLTHVNKNFEAHSIWRRLVRDHTPPHSAVSRFANFLGYQLRRHKEAIEVYNSLLCSQSLDLASESRYVNNLGQLHILRFNDEHNVSDFWSARKCFQQAVELYPANVWPQRNMDTFTYLYEGQNIREEFPRHERTVVNRRTQFGFRAVTIQKPAAGSK